MIIYVETPYGWLPLPNGQAPPKDANWRYGPPPEESLPPNSKDPNDDRPEE